MTEDTPPKISSIAIILEGNLVLDEIPTHAQALCLLFGLIYALHLDYPKGEAQQAAHSLPAAARADFRNLKKAVLDRMGFSPEDHRRRFRETTLTGEDRPFAYAQRLTDMARRWLQPEIRSAAAVVEQVVLERFTAGLPADTASWVQCHRPTNLDVAVTLAEDHLAQHPFTQQQKPEPAPSC
ncbi:hypothetical protein SKAU_G00280750 [Synaphobranchus kaupii]|uniref:SCAN box domain-containing protein n=1 Tax=Synaphobranchus kaupii TaxID=118154 RepID=A0A9Q1IMZ9_SYNKA|nr:hypothetical protein SKAU_G00280750 [Synaphobranchus kaupii]